MAKFILPGYCEALNTQHMQIAWPSNKAGIEQKSPLHLSLS